MKKHLLALLAFAMFTSTSVIAFAAAPTAQNKGTYPNFYELTMESDRKAEFLSESGKIMPRASYDLTSDVDIRNKDISLFQTYGWVDIVDKKSGTDLDHSTTAVVANYYDPQSYKGAVKEVGAGKVYATSEWVNGWSWPRIFWDW